MRGRSPWQPAAENRKFREMAVSVTSETHYKVAKDQTGVSCSARFRRRRRNTPTWCQCHQQDASLLFGYNSSCSVASLLNNSSFHSSPLARSGSLDGGATDHTSTLGTTTSGYIAPSATAAVERPNACCKSLWEGRQVARGVAAASWRERSRAKQSWRRGRGGAPGGAAGVGAEPPMRLRRRRRRRGAG